MCVGGGGYSENKIKISHYPPVSHAFWVLIATVTVLARKVSFNNILISFNEKD